MPKTKKGGAAGASPQRGTPRFAPIHGSRFTQRDADQICPYLLRHSKRLGGLTSEDVLSLAGPRNSVLHRHVFSLSDKDAAAAHRLTLCSRILRGFEVIYTVGKRGKTVERRSKLLHYVVQQVAPEEASAEEEAIARIPRVRPKSAPRPTLRRAYVTTVEVMSSPEYQRQLMEDAYQALLTYRNRYRRVQELLNFKSAFGRVFSAICKLCDQEEFDD